jgi:hypothetical protein
MKAGSNAALAPKLAAIAVVGILLVGLGAYEYLQTTSFHPQATTTSSTPGSATSISSSANSSANPSSSTSAESSSTISPAPCAQPYLVPANNVTTLANGTQITESAKPVLVVGAGSTMELCVEFVDPAYTNQSVYTTTDLYAFSWPDSPGVVTIPPANNVSTTATPENISLSAGQGTVVEYKLSTGENSTGFDGLNVGPLGDSGCRAIPLAVGYLPSQVNSSDFSSYYQGFPECPPGNLVAAVVGYTGASIAYLRSETVFNPTENVTDISVSSSPTSGGEENITFRMHVQSFSHTVALGVPAIDSSILRVFTENPELVTLANNYCSWIPDNQTADSGSKLTTFNELPSGYLQFDSPTLQMRPYSSANYTFSVLIFGPIASNTAMDVGIIVGNAFVGASSFPVSVAGQLQTISGSCQRVIG